MSLHRAATVCKFMFALAIAALLAGSASPALAQFVAQQVGGVAIDAAGELKNITPDEAGRLLAERARALQPVPAGMKDAAPLRKISLRRLEAAIAEHHKNGTPLPDDVRYLAGLQRIQYVFVYPKQHDIVLVGPGEGWKVGPQGEIVGVTNGLPVLLLDDLLVALRATPELRQTMISCSIDPTDEGIVKLRSLVKQLNTIGDPETTAAGIEQTLGPQMIRVTGVPESSHFARVMVAADYRMKRLAMNFDKSPVKGLPSFLHLMKGGRAGMNSMLPRWWLAPHYEAIVADPNGMAFEFRGGNVKALTEEDFVTASGARQGSGKANPVAQRWADNMTAHYDELCRAEPVFGQLRNCVDLALLAALIEKEQLTERAGHSLPLLLNSDLPVERYHAPKQVATQASLLQKGTNWLISASGGVQINPWEPLQKQSTTADLSAEHTSAAPPETGWWWN